MPETILALVGPTGSGKTKLAVELARHLAPAELVNADSRQVLQGLRVGTCAPTAAELGGVVCHLLEICDPGEPFTVADWASRARQSVKEIAARGALGIVVGGTGLYVTALVDGLDFGLAPPDPLRRAARTTVAQTPEGVARLAAELRRRDPARATQVDLRNPRRVIRALEILDAYPGGLGAARPKEASVPALILGLDPPSTVHETWIRERTERMLTGGALVDEVRRLLERGIPAPVLAASGIGYGEAISVLGGRLPVPEAIQLTTRRTLRYARAQRAYWRRDHRVEWLDPLEVDPAALARNVAERLRAPAAEPV